MKAEQLNDMKAADLRNAAKEVNDALATLYSNSYQSE